MLLCLFKKEQSLAGAFLMHLAFGYASLACSSGQGPRVQKMTAVAHAPAWTSWAEKKALSYRTFLGFCLLALLSPKPCLSFKKSSFSSTFPSPSLPHFTLLIAPAGCPPGWDYSECRVRGGCWEETAGSAFSFANVIGLWLTHVENNQHIWLNFAKLLKEWEEGEMRDVSSFNFSFFLFHF